MMMGGGISVKSTVDVGSTFTFSGWFEAAESEVSNDMHSALRGVTVLVVDDNPTSLQMLDQQLIACGAQSAAVSNAKDALSELRGSRARGYTFDVVLIDADMPELSGFDLAELLMKEPGFNSNIVMILSSAGDLGDAARCRTLGLEDRVIKPVSRAELVNALLHAMRKTSRQSMPPPPVEKPAVIPQTADGLRVLLVEDNPINRKVAIQLLKKRGHTVTTATNGREALDTLEEIDWQVDVILMDVQMPEMDGYQATKVIREREIARGIHMPIVAMTAHALERDREECLAAGMDSYVSKPVQAHKLYDAIEEIAGDRAGKPVLQ
jgi:CheY-like chemotaxis protein